MIGTILSLYRYKYTNRTAVLINFYDFRSGCQSVTFTKMLKFLLENKMIIFLHQHFRGNRDSNSMKYHEIPIPVMTSEIIILPQTWAENVGLRLELYGCDPGKENNYI